MDTSSKKYCDVCSTLNRADAVRCSLCRGTSFKLQPRSGFQGAAGTIDSVKLPSFLTETDEEFDSAFSKSSLVGHNLMPGVKTGKSAFQMTRSLSMASGLSNIRLEKPQNLEVSFESKDEMALPSFLERVQPPRRSNISTGRRSRSPFRRMFDDVKEPEFVKEVESGEVPDEMEEFLFVVSEGSSPDFEASKETSTSLVDEGELLPKVDIQSESLSVIEDFNLSELLPTISEENFVEGSGDIEDVGNEVEHVVNSGETGKEEEPELESFVSNLSDDFEVKVLEGTLEENTQMFKEKLEALESILNGIEVDYQRDVAVLKMSRLSTMQNEQMRTFSAQIEKYEREIEDLLNTQPSIKNPSPLYQKRYKAAGIDDEADYLVHQNKALRSELFSYIGMVGELASSLKSMGLAIPVVE